MTNPMSGFRRSATLAAPEAVPEDDGTEPGAPCAPPPPFMGPACAPAAETAPQALPARSSAGTATESPRPAALIITRRAAVLEAAAEALDRIGRHGMGALHGTAALLPVEAFDLVPTARVVIVEFDGSAEIDTPALARLVAAGGSGTRFIGVTEGDLSLAQARRIMKSGFEDVLPVNGDAEDLADSLAAALRDGAPRSGVPAGAAPDRKGVVIAVTQGRGGLGATTVAVNLADLLRDPQGLLIKSNRNSVVLADLDLQFGNAGSYLDLEDRGAMLEIARSDGVPDVAFLNSALQEHPTGLRVLTAPAAAMPLDALDHARVGAVIDILRSRFDYVVIDMPHVLVSWLEAIVARTDLLLAVTDTSVPAITSTRRLLDLLTEDVPTLRTEIVINRERRPLVLSQAQKLASDTLNLPLRHFLSDDANTARRAVDRGETLNTVAPGSPLTKSLKRLAAHVLRQYPARIDATERV